MRLLLIPILIASALLLSAASPNPSPTVHNGIGSQPSAAETKRTTDDSAATRPSATPSQQTRPAEGQEPTWNSPGSPSPDGTPTPNIEAVQSAIADYTFWLVVVGIVQGAGLFFQAGFLFFTLRATGKYAKATLEQVQLLTRPKVEVSGDTVFEQSTEVTIYFTVLNTGHTEAQITDQRFGIWFYQTSLPFPPALPAGDVESPAPLPKCFEAYDRRASHISQTLKTDVFIGFSDKSQWHAYVEAIFVACLSGYIRYLDKAGKAHTTFFCRAWNRNERKFVIPLGMPDTYNHST